MMTSLSSSVTSRHFLHFGSWHETQFCNTTSDWSVLAVVEANDVAQRAWLHACMHGRAHLIKFADRYGFCETRFR